MTKTNEIKEGIVIAAHDSYFSMEFAPPMTDDLHYLHPGSLHCIDGQTKSATWSRNKFASWDDYLAYASGVASKYSLPLYQHTPDNDGRFLHKDPLRDFEVYELDTVTDETTEIVRHIAPQHLEKGLTAAVLRRYVCERESALLVARLKDEQATMIGFCALEIVTDFPNKRLLRANPYIGNDYREYKIGSQLLGAMSQWAATQNVTTMTTSLPSTKLPLLG